VSEPNPLSIDSVGHESTYLGKVKFKLVSYLIKNIPLLADTDPEKIAKFLISVSEDYDLKLVTDSEFMSLLLCRTSGRITQILGAHLGTTQTWALAIPPSGVSG
jgi:hypothetical protein